MTETTETSKPDWIRKIEAANDRLERERLAAAVSPMARPQFEAARQMAKNNRDEKMGRAATSSG